MFRHFYTTASCLLAIIMGAGMVSCQSDKDDMAPSAGKARVAFDIRTDSKFASRAVDESKWQNAANYTVEITNGSGVVLHTFTGAEIPSTLEMEKGNYSVHAYYGAEHVASRTEFLSEGRTDFTVNPSDEKNVSILCEPTCGKVTVNFGADMATYFDDYYVTLSTAGMDQGLEATWAKSDTDPWYFTVGANGDVVTATIHLTPNQNYATDKANATEDWSEGTVIRTYTLKRNKAWTLSINPSYTTANGKLGISISVDDSTNDKDVDIVIPAEWI